MPEISIDRVRVHVPVGDEDAIFICRRPSGREMSKYLSSRFKTHRNKVTNVAYEVRPSFAKSLIEDAENITFSSASGEKLELNARTVLTPEDMKKWSLSTGDPVTSWVDMIPVNWLCSVAMYFEESQPADESEGN